MKKITSLVMATSMFFGVAAVTLAQSYGYGTNGAQGTSYAALKSTSITVGAHGAEVLKYQTLLSNLGYYNGALDSTFGIGMKNAVKEFQMDHNLTADGILGTGTKWEITEEVEADSGNDTNNDSENPWGSDWWGSGFNEQALEDQFNSALGNDDSGNDGDDNDSNNNQTSNASATVRLTDSSVRTMVTVAGTATAAVVTMDITVKPNKEDILIPANPFDALLISIEGGSSTASAIKSASLVAKTGGMTTVSGKQYYKVAKGKTRHFTVDAYIDPSVAGTYRIQIPKMRYADTDGDMKVIGLSSSIHSDSVTLQ